jgi:glycosyltransferase involved in cell wall biosynthesis
MRGFWADERVDGKIWNLKNPVFKMIFNYFKRKEKEFIHYADHIVVLTEQGKNILNTWQPEKNKKPVSVIPCCVDTALFSYDYVDSEKIKSYKKTLNISENTKIISYLGSIGTWYMADEMMDFFKILSDAKSDFKFMFITYDKAKDIFKLADKHKVSIEKIMVVKAQRTEVPVLLSLINISIFFIKPVFSKKASSPTKQAEVLSMGIPIICNDGIGDTSEIISKNKAGIVIKEFNPNAYLNAINQIDDILKIPKDIIRQTAVNCFSLEYGGEKYNTIYQSLKKS